MAYFVVHDWMTKELHLKGLQKELYAIIYGFSQDGESEFYGSLNYLAELTGNTTRGVQKALTELVNANLLSATKIDGKPTRYKVNPRTQFTPTHELSSPNNKDNRKEIISKDITPRKNLYQQCVDVIHELITDIDVQERLEAYLSVRLRDNTVSAKSWRTIVNKLFELADTKAMPLKVVQQSIDKSYRSLYPVSYSPNTQRVDTATLTEDYLTKAYHEWAEDGRFFGDKEEFKKLVQMGEITL